MTETIFALATAIGKSGVAIIRISGPDASRALDYFQIKKIEPRKANYAALRLPTGDVLDHGLVIYFKGPGSFTGEDTVELHLHGGRAIIKSCLGHLSTIAQYRLARPGEFSKRAFLNGKMDLTQAEGLADLIEAETEIQRQQAIRQMEGQLYNLYEKWRSDIIDLQMLVEAYIDFPEEDIPEDVLESMQAKLGHLIDALCAHLHDGARGERIRQGFMIAILGAPNVGKSSLLNCLAKQDVAIVSDIAGTTRDALEVHLDLGGYSVTVVDTAGIRENTDDTIEREGIRRAQKAGQSADIKIIMYDASMPKDAQLELFNEYRHGSHVVVGNKSDLLDCTLTFSDSADNQSQNCSNLPLSTRTGEGVENLLQTLLTSIESQYHVGQDPVITRLRYREALVQVREILMQLNVHAPIELVAEDLRCAAQAIAQITGKIDVDDILDRIFSQFCIGK